MVNSHKNWVKFFLFSQIQDVDVERAEGNDILWNGGKRWFIVEKQRKMAFAFHENLCLNRLHQLGGESRQGGE